MFQTGTTFIHRSVTPMELWTTEPRDRVFGHDRSVSKFRCIFCQLVHHQAALVAAAAAQGSAYITPMSALSSPQTHVSIGSLATLTNGIAAPNAITSVAGECKTIPDRLNYLQQRNIFIIFRHLKVLSAQWNFTSIILEHWVTMILYLIDVISANKLILRHFITLHSY